MSVRAALAAATARLEAAGVDSAASDARALLAHVLGVEFTRLAIADSPTPEQKSEFERLVAARAERKPLQHLLGTVGFRYVEVAVGPGVFIPRPETELLAGWAIAEAQKLANPVVVELCAGTGAITLSLAHESPGAQLYAVEVDPAAFEWTKRNLAATNTDLRLGDMADAFGDLDAQVDIVVANPPYVPEAEQLTADPEVTQHDPALALWSGPDGLEAIRVVENVAWRLLRPGGVVGVEHADSQGESAPAVFAARWQQVVDHLDLNDRPRYLTGLKPIRD